jgi:hypothetical protein
LLSFVCLRAQELLPYDQHHYDGTRALDECAQLIHLDSKQRVRPDARLPSARLHHLLPACCSCCCLGRSSATLDLCFLLGFFSVAESFCLLAPTTTDAFVCT